MFYVLLFKSNNNRSETLMDAIIMMILFVLTFTVILTGVFKGKTIFYGTFFSKEIEDFIFNLEEDESDSLGCSCCNVKSFDITVKGQENKVKESEFRKRNIRIKKRVSINDPCKIELLKHSLNLYEFPKKEVDRTEKDENKDLIFENI